MSLSSVWCADTSMGKFKFKYKKSSLFQVSIKKWFSICFQKLSRVSSSFPGDKVAQGSKAMLSQTCIVWAYPNVNVSTHVHSTRGVKIICACKRTFLENGRSHIKTNYNSIYCLRWDGAILVRNPSVKASQRQIKISHVVEDYNMWDILPYFKMSYHFYCVLVIIWPVETLFNFFYGVVPACMARQILRVAFLEHPRFLVSFDDKSLEGCSK